MWTGAYKFTRLACVFDVVPEGVEYLDLHTKVLDLNFYVKVTINQDSLAP
jgi:hypothetical protein